MTHNETDVIWTRGIVHCAHRRHARGALAHLIHFKQNTPDRLTELHDHRTPVGASCVAALALAVKRNDQHSMVVLFAKQRAKQVLKNSILKSPTHTQGLNFLKNLVSLNNGPTGFAESLQALHATPYPGNNKLWSLDEPINALVERVEELFVSYADKQVIVRAIAVEDGEPTVRRVRKL